MAQGQAHHGGYPADRHHPQQVVLRIAVVVYAGPQEGEQGFPGQEAGQGKAGGDRRPRPDAEGGHVADLPLPLHPQHPGDQAVAAQAEEVAQGGEQIEPGGHQGHRRHHQRISGLADEEGVGQVVDHGHHLADDGGDGQCGHGPGNRDGFKQLSLTELRHGSGSAFFPAQTFLPSWQASWNALVSMTSPFW